MSEIGKVGEESAKTYDIWSDTYDTCKNPTRDLDEKALKSQNFELAGKRVVEFGCGTGRHSEWILKQCTSILSFCGMDVSDGMLSKARERVENNPKATFLRQDLTAKWPFEDGSVDLLYGDLVLEHIEHLQPFFNEAKRVLAQGGKLFICEFHPYKQYQGRLTRFPNPADENQELNPPCYVHSVEEYVNEAVDGGVLRLDKLNEWHDGVKSTPRLLSLNFTKV